jgi:hypothetical protein
MTPRGSEYVTGWLSIFIKLSFWRLLIWLYPLFHLQWVSNILVMSVSIQLVFSSRYPFFLNCNTIFISYVAFTDILCLIAATSITVSPSNRHKSGIFKSILNGAWWRQYCFLLLKNFNCLLVQCYLLFHLPVPSLNLTHNLLITFQLFSMNFTYEEFWYYKPKSHIHFLLHWLLQRICRRLMAHGTFGNMVLSLVEKC